LSYQANWELVIKLVRNIPGKDEVALITARIFFTFISSFRSSNIRISYIHNFIFIFRDHHFFTISLNTRPQTAGKNSSCISKSKKSFPATKWQQLTRSFLFHRDRPERVFLAFVNTSIRYSDWSIRTKRPWRPWQKYP